MGTVRRGVMLYCFHSRVRLESQHTVTVASYILNVALVHSQVWFATVAAVGQQVVAVPIDIFDAPGTTASSSCVSRATPSSAGK